MTKVRGRPTIDESMKLKPRFTLTLKQDDWNNLKSNTDHPLSFTRDAISEKIERERQLIANKEEKINQ